MTDKEKKESPVQIKIYEALPDDARLIRTEVFVQEQGFMHEFDDTDVRALHLVAYEGENPVAVCRLFYSEERASYLIGRVAVRRAYRGKNYGAAVILACEDVLRERQAHRVELSAQVRSLAFYQKCGYTAEDEMHLDEGCPHVWMWKEI